MTTTLVVPCVHCTSLNRVPAARVQDVPLCATCRARLLAGDVAEFDDAGLDRFVRRSSLPVLLDCWAPWCEPCRTMAPWFAAAARRLAGRVLAAKLDTEAHPDAGARLAVRSIPTLILFAQGGEVARTSGAMPEPQIVAWVDEHA